ncbi:hypothetical protein BH11VER1_BH11VER1_29320 [soil metagenome]
MKICLTLVVALLMAPLTGAFSQVPSGPPQITVTGSSEVKVAPDEIYLNVGVETRHETLEEAKRENDERITKALVFIRGSGVKDKEVQTDFLSVEPVYDRDVSRTKPTFYLIRKSIEIRFTKIPGFEAFVTGLLSNGVTTIHGIDFRTTEMRKHRDTARAMAVRAACEKADALTAELGVKRGKVCNISTNDWSGSSSWGRSGANIMQNSVQSFNNVQEADPSSTLSVGQISVTASVNVSFALE